MPLLPSFLEPDLFHFPERLLYFSPFLSERLRPSPPCPSEQEGCRDRGISLSTSPTEAPTALQDGVSRRGTLGAVVPIKNSCPYSRLGDEWVFKAESPFVQMEVFGVQGNGGMGGAPGIGGYPALPLNQDSQ